MNMRSIRGAPQPLIRFGRLLTIAAAAILIAACASAPPPVDHVAGAAAAVARAAGAGGEEAAPQDMRTARDKLQRANVAMTVKDYPLALSLSQEIEVDAQLAEAKARSSRARKGTELQRDDNRVLREELERKTK